MIAAALAEEEKNAFEAAEREKLRVARQAEQRRTLIAKAEMEREIERIRLLGRKKKLVEDDGEGEGVKAEEPKKKT
jgi:hypothetical protein